MATVGDAERTAAALNLTPEIVKELAEREGWNEKVRRISLMSKSEKPGDYERATNRALNFVQAHQLREMIESFLRHLRLKTPEEIEGIMTTTDRLGGTHLSARFFSDMAKAVETCHAMSYAALGDTIGDRKVNAGAGANGQPNAAGIHAAVIAALNANAVVSSEAQDVLEVGQRDEVEQLTEGE